jgi:lipid II:glycine glycyltransferase (peptidoglycan interpeptide bridge formation enzyme)
MGLQQIDRVLGGVTELATVTVEVTDRPDAVTLAEWDRLVSGRPGSDVAQLSAWARTREQAGFTPRYVLARAGDELVGGALVLSRRVPGLRDLVYVPFGPVLTTDLAVGPVCRALADIAQQSSATFVQPMAGGTDVSGELLRIGFRTSTAGIAPAASVAIDLDQPVDRLRAGLRSGTRNSIARARKQGVRVRHGGEADLATVAELLGDSAAHHGFTGSSLEHLRTMYRALAPGGHIQIFLAERDGTALAADVLTAAGDVLTLRLTGMRRGSEVAKLGAAALLRWETMLWARAHGCGRLDLGGIPSSAVAEIRAGKTGLASRVDGRTYYKASFGGEAFSYPPAVELIPSAVLRLGYDATVRNGVGRRILRAAKALLRGSGR